MDQEFWLERLLKLRVDRARDKNNPAPHKPLLLLNVIDLAEKRLLKNNTITLSAELAFGFHSFWRIVSHRRRQPPDIRLPFHYLKSDSIWDVLDEDGKPSVDKKLTKFAVMNEDFFQLIHDSKFRKIARKILIARFFQPMEKIALYKLVDIKEPEDDPELDLLDKKIKQNNRKTGREVHFRISVVSAYNYTCALTGYRLNTLSSSIIDAAHIHSFASSRNNNPTNGIALSKNAHWLFDQGLWTTPFSLVTVVTSIPCGRGKYGRNRNK